MNRIISILTFAAALAFSAIPAPRAAAAQPAREPAVVTDQADYTPGATATFIGADFLPGETVELQVQPAGAAHAQETGHSSWLVQANGEGDFLTTWQVCEQECVGLELRVTATGLKSGVSAQAVFGDGLVISTRALFAKTASTTIAFQSWLNVLNQWGGTVQNSNSRYGDGDTIPLRFVGTLAAGSTHTLVLKYDFSTGGAQRFFDSLGSYNTSAANPPLLSGITNAGAALSWAIPVDTSLPSGAQLPGVLTAYNVSAMSFGSYALVSGVKALTVTFTVASGGTANKTVVVGYGAHLAGQNIWGAGNGASQFPGASQKAYVSLDGGSTANISVNPSTILSAADLSLTKLASPEPVYSGDNLTYQLTVKNNGPDPASLVVVTDSLPAGVTFVSASSSQGTVSGTNNVVFSVGTLNAGTYATLSLLVKVTTTNAGTIKNTATVSSATYDPQPTNNTASVVSTVQIRDIIPPTVTCPATITQSTDAGKCSAVVFYTATATDNNPGVVLVCTPPPGSTFPVGTNTVVCVATDAAGNQSSCSFKIVVVDTEKPSVVCPSSVVVTNDPGLCSAVVRFTVSAADNCPGVTVGSSPVSGFAFPVGTNTVLCVAQDASGNTNICTFTVTVVDREPPQITCPATILTTPDTNSCFGTVNFATPTALDNCGGPVAVTCNPPSGSMFAVGTNVVLCTAVDLAGNSNQCAFLVVVQDPGNQSWPKAMPLTLLDNLGVQQASAAQCLNSLDQSRWFKFHIQPGSRVVVTLTSLPENYDLVLFKDIGAAYQTLTSLDDLTRLSAEFAADAFSPSAFSQDAFSPSAFSPSAFSPSAFSPSAFSPSAFSPSAFSPSAFSPSAFSPDAFSPSAFSPSAFSPSAFSPSAFSPSAFSPSAFSPSAFSAAQIQSVLAVSAFDGTASEGLVVDTWDNTGSFYVRVRGRNGVFSTANPFQLNVYEIPGACGSISPVALDANNQPLPPSTTAAPAGNYKTIILTDLNRWLGAAPSADKTNVSNALAALALRPDVNGVVVDVGADLTVAYFNAQADKNFDCPFAKNLVAGAIKGIVDRSRTGNALQYVVLIGDDSVIPFFRYPDEALLGPERNYTPPVKDLTASEASLRLDRVLNQDAYGSRCSVSLKSMQLPLPDLAVGRLVQSASEVIGQVNSYLGTPGGVVSSAASALVTGYDFLADDAQAVSNELAQAMGSTPDTLISPNNLAPSLCWTADNLRQALFSKRHDILFLAGHFSASEALAADYSTHVFASELANSALDFHNTLLISPGCHSGYNIVAADSIPFVTIEPDWTLACARKQMTLVAGTGYQYGDTDFIEYSERLYLELMQALRSGAGPVSIGQALVNAKHVYLAATPEMRGIHTKAYLEATLFGLPMLSVNFSGARRAADVTTPIVTSTQRAATDPGATLGLSMADVAVNSTLTPTTLTLVDPSGGPTTLATYLAGSSGIINNPAEPIMPLEVRNVGVNGTVLRGVGFRGGLYSDLTGIVPLTGAATTEIRGVHAAFLSQVFYPMRPWSLNYFGALCGGVDGSTRLMAIPGQFKSDSPTSSTGTLRDYREMDFRLFYSSNVTTYTDSAGNASTPSLAGPPSISAVTGVTSADQTQVGLSVRVVGNPAAGVQEVWVTYTALAGGFYGKWQSLELTQSMADSTLWQGILPLGGTPSSLVRYMVQAVNGAGAVALDTKFGAYHVPDEFDAANTAQLAPTSVILLSPPTTGAYGTHPSFSAQLKAANGTPLSGQTLIFGVADQQVWATTDSNGVASASLGLFSRPADYQLLASFPGAAGLAPSFATGPFTVTRQATALTITPSLLYVKPNVDTKVIATLTDVAGNRLIERTVIFIVSGPNGAYAVPVITDMNGRADLGPVPLPAGNYTVAAYFNGSIPLPGQSITVDDGHYVPSTTAGTLTVTLVLDNQAPLIICSTNVVHSTDPGLCSAVVNYVTTATDDNPGVTLVCNPPSGSVFPKGTSTVNCVATDAAGNISSCGFTVTIVDTQPPSLSCPTNVTVSTDPGKPTAVVTFAPSATDNCPGVTVGSSPVSGTAFPIGTNSVLCVAKDAAGNQTQCNFTVTVRDLEAPIIQSITASPNVLFPPNHTMVLITITVNATDNSGTVNSTITSVTSSDPTTTTGLGSPSGDWYVTGPLTLYVRSERIQSGVGRTYTITIQTSDPSGNTKTGTVTVFIPPDAS